MLPSNYFRRLDRPCKGLTRPLPEAALDVVVALRRDVPRPRELPIGCPLRFDMVHMGREFGWTCPQGLHPRANHDEDYGLLFGADGEVFGSWWDEQEDAQAAVDAVWGKERR